MIRSRFSLSIVAFVIAAAACTDGTGPAPTPTDASTFSKGGGNGSGGGTPTPAVCALITVTNSAPTVRHLNMPIIKYNLENCGSSALSVTVTISESAGFLSVLCPSPVAPPVQYALGIKQKISATAPVFRGPCGLSSNVNGVLVQSPAAFQGHNLVLTVTDNSTHAVLSRSGFNWQDSLRPGA